MPIKDKQTINVLNYNDNPVVVSTRDTSYVIESAENGTPTKMPFSFQEIETMNGNGSAFESGLLRFESEDEAEAYETLRITNWKNILKNDEIEEIILNPTYDGLRRIVDIKSSSMFERVRGIYTRLKNDERNDISNRIERIVSTRYRELISGKIKTEIVLTQKDSEKPVLANVGEIKAENEALKTQMEELKSMMSALLEKKNVDTSASSSDVAASDIPVKKSARAK